MASDRGEYRSIARVLIDGKDFRALSERARSLFLFLKIGMGPSGIEVQYAGALEAQLAGQTGQPIAAVCRGLDELEAAGWIVREENVLWVVDQLRYDPHMQASNENHRKAVQRHVEGLPHLPIVKRFRCHYATFFVGCSPDLNGMGDGIGDGIPIAAPITDNRIPRTITENREPNTDGAFETFWKNYPKRAGGNPRQKAEHAWAARLKEGFEPIEMLAGEVRYAAFLKATGKTGTEYVMHAATFVGPAKRWTESWDVPPPPTNGRERKPQVYDYSQPTAEFKGFTK